MYALNIGSFEIYYLTYALTRKAIYKKVCLIIKSTIIETT